MSENFKACAAIRLGDPFGVDRDDDALIAKTSRGIIDQIRIGDGSRVDADLVRTSI